MKKQKTMRTIGVKEFRQNFGEIQKGGKKNKTVYFVMNHQRPVLRVETIDEDQMLLELYADQIKEGIEAYKRGEFYTLEEVMEQTRRRKK